MADMEEAYPQLHGREPGGSSLPGQLHFVLQTKPWTFQEALSNSSACSSAPHQWSPRNKHLELVKLFSEFPQPAGHISAIGLHTLDGCLLLCLLS